MKNRILSFLLPVLTNMVACVALVLLMSAPANAQVEDFSLNTISVGKALGNFEPNTWYFMYNGSRSNELGRFLTVGETPTAGGFVFDNGTGNDALKKPVTDVADNSYAPDMTAYMVRFIDASEEGESNVYQIQFATGNYLASNLKTEVSNKYDAAKFNVYNISEDDPGKFGFNRYNMGSLINNNGVWYSLVYWKSGQITSTDYDTLVAADTKNSVWSIVDIEWTQITEIEASRIRLKQVYSSYNTYREGFESNMGTTPGQYGVAAVAAFGEALNAANVDNPNIDTSTWTVEDYEAHGQAIIDAYEAVLAAKVPLLSSGYYRIKTRLTYAVAEEVPTEGEGVYTYSIKDKYMYSNPSGDEIQALWGSIDDEKYAATAIWQVTQVTPDNYEIVNLGTEAGFLDIAISANAKMTTEGGNIITLTTVGVADNDNNMFVAMRSSTPTASYPDYQYMHQGGHGYNPARTDGKEASYAYGTGGNIVGWTVDADASQWLFVPVSQEEVDAAVAAYDIVKNHDKLLAQYDELVADALPKIEIAKSTSQYSLMGTIATNLEDAIAALDGVADENITVEQYNALKDAYDAFIAKFVDPTELRNKLEETKSLYETVDEIVKVGTDPGFWSEGSDASSFGALWREASAYDAAGDYTPAQSADYVERLSAGSENLFASANGVDEGKWYYFRFPTEDEFTENNWTKQNGGGDATYSDEALYGKYAIVADANAIEGGGYTINTVTKEKVTLGAEIYFINEVDALNNDMAKFRFINVGDTAYIIQNKGTGLFINAGASGDGAVKLSVHPSLFNTHAVGYGLNHIATRNLKGGNQSDLHAQRTGNVLVSWDVAAEGIPYVGSRSAFYIKDADENVAANYDGTKFNLFLKPGKIYTYCFPVEVSVKEGNNATMWDVSSVDFDNVSVTLYPINKAIAGQPFFLVCGDAVNNYNPSNDNVEVITMLHGYDIAAVDPDNSLEIKGSYYGETVGGGVMVANGNTFVISKQSSTAVDINSAYIADEEPINENLWEHNVEINWSRVQPLADNIAFSDNTLTWEIGTTQALFVTSAPRYSVMPNLLWSSTNTNVATVDENGVATATGVGATVIVAYAPELNKSAMCTLNVYAMGDIDGDNDWDNSDINQLARMVIGQVKANEAADINRDNAVTLADVTALVNAVTHGSYPGWQLSLSESAVTLEMDAAVRLKAQALPTCATLPALTWTSSDENVAEVTASGLVSAVGYGTCTITCTASDGSGNVATCEVTVPKHVTAITLSESSLNLAKTTTQTLTASVTPSDADDSSVTWTSSDTNVATVSETGQITAVGIGTCTITCTSNENGNVTASCEVTVWELVLSASTLNLEVDGYQKLNVSANPSTVTAPSVTWTSSNENVAEVNSRGLVYAIGSGTCTITCTASDGSGATARCLVSVSE